MPEPTNGGTSTREVDQTPSVDVTLSPAEPDLVAIEVVANEEEDDLAAASSDIRRRFRVHDRE